jgi:hypothetical protein
MAKHDVTFNVPERKLGKADITFSVKRDGKQFGILKVSNGSIVWVQKSQQSGFKLKWAEFDKIITKKGKKQ